MMLIRMGFGGQLSGSVGGVVASHNKGGAYLRNRSVPTNPNSGRQQTIRLAMGACGPLWNGATQAVRDGWEGYAAETPTTNRLGESIYLSGWNMFCRTYVFFASCGQVSAFPAVAPSTPGMATLTPPSSIVVADTPTVRINDGIDLLDGPGIVSISPPLNAGVKFCRGPYTAYLTAADFSAIDGVATAGNQATNRYGVPLLGERRCVRIAGADSEGRLSTSYEEIATVVAGP